MRLHDAGEAWFIDLVASRVAAIASLDLIDDGGPSPLPVIFGRRGVAEQRVSVASTWLTNPFGARA